MTDATIGFKVGKAANHYKVAKHFIINIRHGCFSFTRNSQSMFLEAMGTLTRNRCVIRLKENSAAAHTRKTKASAKTAEDMKGN
ncbi:MAG: hypothetical protein ACP5I8_05825, partial [Phycisphaerae bacterium]